MELSCLTILPLNREPIEVRQRDSEAEWESSSFPRKQWILILSLRRSYKDLFLPETEHISAIYNPTQGTRLRLVLFLYISELTPIFRPQFFFLWPNTRIEITFRNSWIKPNSFCNASIIAPHAPTKQLKEGLKWVKYFIKTFSGAKGESRRS